MEFAARRRQSKILKLLMGLKVIDAREHMLFVACKHFPPFI